MIKLRMLISLLVGFTMGFVVAVIFVFTTTEIKIEKSPMKPNEEQALLIQKARSALEHENFQASAYFCSSIRDEGGSRVVEFNDDCGNVSVQMPFGFGLGLSSLCMTEHLVQVHDDGAVQVIRR